MENRAKKLIECVPNISEGRDSTLVAAVVEAVSSVTGVKLLHVDSGIDTNRTVITFAGEPEPVVSAAFLLVKRAVELIDMRKHEGAHPRLGAVDVCPLVPLSGISMEECAVLARELGARVGSELGLPVYIYGKAALVPARESFKNIRDGQYEGLPRKIASLEWKPDFGPAEFNAKSGAITIGARPILIAYNVNVTGREVVPAKQIAKIIRRDKLLPKTQALGWFLESLRTPQVSFNLFDFQQTGLFEVFECVRKLAPQFGAEVRGSELVGLVPKAALLDVAEKCGVIGGDEASRLAVAIEHLGLNMLRPFSTQWQVLDFRMAQA